MRILVTSLKGGVGKTTTAIHIAAFLQERAPTLLIDADPVEGALTWAKQGSSLPFDIASAEEAKPKKYQNVVIDTRGHPKGKTLREYADKADLLVIPTTPGLLSLESLEQFMGELEDFPFQALVTLVPPFPSLDGMRTLNSLKTRKIPHFKSVIRRFAAYEKAVINGSTVREVVGDPRAGWAWNDYNAVGHQLLDLSRRVFAGKRKE